MSLALLTVLLAAPATLPACSWDRPGVNPFMGDVVAAVDRYSDIPAEVRKKLKERVAKRAYDEMATIERDAIVGKATYEPAIRDMHFGAGQVCRTVTRKNWTEKMQERGLVYCESGHCLIVPTVCRNVSRITRKAAALVDNDAIETKSTMAASTATGADEAQTGGGSAAVGAGDLPPAAGVAGASFNGPAALGFVGGLIDAVRSVGGFIAAMPSALFSSAPVSRIAALFGGEAVPSVVPVEAPIV